MRNIHTYGVNGGIDPFIINVGTVRNWVVSFLFWKI